MNPFSRAIFPENMDDGLIQSLFVSEMTNIKNVLNENHHIVWGSRGAGKSMLFRYIYSKNPDKYSDFEKFDHTRNRLSIYLKIRQGTLNVKEFLLLEEQEAMAISEHMLNMYVTQAVIKALQKISGIDKNVLVDIAREVIYSVYDHRITDSIDRVNKRYDITVSPLEWLHEVTVSEIDRITYYFRRRKSGVVFDGAYTGYHDYLYHLFLTLQTKLGGGKLKFFILVDDAGNMYPFQQKIINNWIANRDHDLLTVKISATKNDYVCFSTPDDVSIDPTHDYLETELDVIYYGKEDYEDRLIKIVEKRFQAYGLDPISPIKLFPDNVPQQKLINDCETELRQMFVANHPNVSWAVYKSRHLMPFVFQRLNDKHRNFSYSGFKNLVSLSSGIVRTFLLMSAEMWDLAEAQDEGKPISYIPSEIQDDVARRQAKDFLQKIPTIYKDKFYINKYSQNEEIGFEIVNKIENLLSTLGSYFRDRLLNPDLEEQIMFSFSIKNPSHLTTEMRAILDLATMHSYLQRSTYSRKDSGIREEWYLLSRRLSPVYNLYTGAIKGRVMFSAEDLELAATSSEKFMEKRRAQSRKKYGNHEDQLTLFPSDDEEIVLDEEVEGDVRK